MTYYGDDRSLALAEQLLVQARFGGGTHLVVFIAEQTEAGNHFNGRIFIRKWQCMW